MQQLDAIGIQDSQVRRTFLQLISAQQNPAAKARIFEKITPAPLPPEDLALFLKELELVRQSSDPEVRADGLIRTAAWDRSEAVAGVLRKGLYDQNPEVVRAAATAVLISNVRTQEIKDALLMQASDATPNSQLQRSALEALRDFSLNREEYVIYHAAYDRASTDSQK
ncbi:HEAT repeat domain-containing protein [Lysobacter sp. CA199]|uniref:HEAT repeat domain-containing protein n=1 Tax=Lysobacter sp. CA199 TaxID=3455608 RepID=UPI003F8D6014